MALPRDTATTQDSATMLMAATMETAVRTEEEGSATIAAAMAEILETDMVKLNLSLMVNSLTGNSLSGISKASLSAEDMVVVRRIAATGVISADQVVISGRYRPCEKMRHRRIWSMCVWDLNVKLLFISRSAWMVA